MMAGAIETCWLLVECDEAYCVHGTVGRQNEGVTVIVTNFFIHCTLSNGICHTAFDQDQDGTVVPSWSCSKAV